MQPCSFLGCSGRFGRAGQHQPVLEGTSEQLRAPWEAESSLPPCHCKWLFLSFSELPCLLLLQPQPHPLQPPGQVPLLQLFIKRVIAIIANTFRSIWKPCSLWGYNDAAIITTLVVGERQVGYFGSEAYEGSRGFTPRPPGHAAATVWRWEAPRIWKLRTPSSAIAGSLTLELMSPVQPSFPYLQAMS